MGAISLTKQTWDEGRLTLELIGAPRTEETYWLHAPASWEFHSADADGANVSTNAIEEQIITLRVSFQNARVVIRTNWRRT